MKFYRAWSLSGAWVGFCVWPVHPPHAAHTGLALGLTVHGVCAAWDTLRGLIWSAEQLSDLIWLMGLDELDIPALTKQQLGTRTNSHRTSIKDRCSYAIRSTFITEQPLHL